MKIGILGGTFDPPHNGHLHLAREAKARLSLDKVVFIPAYIPPHKEGRKISSSDIRQKMVEALISDEPNFEISDIELKRGEVSYTIDTLHELHGYYPEGTEFYFLTGADSLEIFRSWKRWEDILKLCKFVVAKRPGFSMNGLPPKTIKLDIPTLDISSTLVRDNIRGGKEIDSVIPAKVKRIIETERLYS